MAEGTFAGLSQRVHRPNRCTEIPSRGDVGNRCFRRAVLWQDWGVMGQ